MAGERSPLAFARRLASGRSHLARRRRRPPSCNANSNNNEADHLGLPQHGIRSFRPFTERAATTSAAPAAGQFAPVSPQSACQSVTGAEIGRARLRPEETAADRRRRCIGACRWAAATRPIVISARRFARHLRWLGPASRATVGPSTGRRATVSRRRAPTRKRRSPGPQAGRQLHGRPLPARSSAARTKRRQRRQNISDSPSTPHDSATATPIDWPE
jgi:hypothetical protein